MIAPGLVALAVLVASPKPPRLAVTDFKDVSGTAANAAHLCTQVAVSEAASAGKFAVIGSDEIQQMLGIERQRQLLGCSDSGCLAELSGALGADYLLTGQLTRAGKRFRLDVRLLDAKRATILASAGEFTEGEDDVAAEAAQRLVRKALIDGHLVDAPAPTAAATPPAPKVEPAPAGGLAAPAPRAEPAGPNRVPAYLAWGGAAVMAAGAGAMTWATRQRFGELQGLQDSPDRETYEAKASDVRFDGYAADGLWLGAALAAGLGTYLYFSAAPTPGGGGEVSVGGSF